MATKVHEELHEKLDEELHEELHEMLHEELNRSGAHTGVKPLPNILFFKMKAGLTVFIAYICSDIHL